MLPDSGLFGLIKAGIYVLLNIQKIDGRAKGTHAKGLECRGLKSPGRRTHHTKTAIIVVVARVVVVAIRGTAIIRLVEPRAATFFMFAPPSILSLRNNDCDRSKNIFGFMASEMATMSLPTKKKTSSERRYFFSIGRYPHV